jgi:hypothetical protein
MSTDSALNRRLSEITPAPADAAMSEAAANFELPASYDADETAFVEAMQGNMPQPTIEVFGAQARAEAERKAQPRESPTDRFERDNITKCWDEITRLGYVRPEGWEYNAITAWDLRQWIVTQHKRACDQNVDAYIRVAARTADPSVRDAARQKAAAWRSAKSYVYQYYNFGAFPHANASLGEMYEFIGHERVKELESERKQRRDLNQQISLICGDSGRLEPPDEDAPLSELSEWIDDNAPLCPEDAAIERARVNGDPGSEWL